LAVAGRSSEPNHAASPGARADSSRPLLPTMREKAMIMARSLLLQSVWNPRGMQDVGFCFALLPMAKRLGHDREALRSFLKRHLRFFNTNPVMASYVLGAVAAAEARGEDAGTIESVKKGLSGPLGMTGDTLLWGSARPFAALLSVALLQAGLGWAPLAMLGLYNAPHVLFRVRGIQVGAERGPMGVAELSGRGVRTAVSVLRAGTAFVAGLLVALAARGSVGAEPWRLVAALLFFVLAYLAIRVRMPATLVAIGGAIGGTVILATGLNGG
jgi:fructoselysine and glucoselysine-specific PTS system IID component